MKKVSVIVMILFLIINVGFVTANDDILFSINGKYIQLEQSVKTIKNRTILPMRALFEYLGAEVGWDNDTNTATGKLGNDTVKFTIDKNIYVKNGEKLETDVSPMLIDGRTYLPIRAVAEALGYGVEWDNDTRTVYINMESPEEYEEQKEQKEQKEEEVKLPKPEIETNCKGNLFYVRFFIKNIEEYDDDAIFKITYIEPEEFNEFDLPNMWTKGWDRCNRNAWKKKSSLQDNEHRAGSPLSKIPTNWYTTRENIDKVKIYDGMPIKFKITVKSGGKEQDFFYEEKILIYEEKMIFD